MNINPPSDFDAEHLADWQRMLAEMEQAGRPIQPGDADILGLYVKTLVINRRCAAHLAKHGPTTQRASGLAVASAEAKMYLETSKLIRGLAADLGTTPASRKFEPVKGPYQKDEFD